VSRAELYTAVWRRPFRKEDRSVDVYVRKLRQKLESALPDWRFIHTHFGFGYRFAPELSHDFHNSVTAR
jgi:DNA-binding response OmpR family regulator